MKILVIHIFISSTLIHDQLFVACSKKNSLRAIPEERAGIFLVKPNIIKEVGG